MKIRISLFSLQELKHKSFMVTHKNLDITTGATSLGTKLHEMLHYLHGMHTSISKYITMESNVRITTSPFSCIIYEFCSFEIPLKCNPLTVEISYIDHPFSSRTCLNWSISLTDGIFSCWLESRSMSHLITCME